MALSKCLIVAFLLVMLAPMECLADDDFEPDNAVTDNNTLTHKSPVQIHTLDGNPDNDFFNVYSIAGRSYEVTLVNMGRVGRGSVSLDLLDFGGLNVIASSTDMVGDVFDSNVSNVRSLRWANTTPVSNIGYIHRVRVQGIGDATSKYAISLRETTQYCPRFNNAGTQITVLLIQRTGTDWSNFAGPVSQACTVHQIYYSESGSRLHTQTNDLQSNAMIVQATNALPALTGQKGSIQIAHTCGFGGIKAKAVALEPATGFSFDTLCSERP